MNVHDRMSSRTSNEFQSHLALDEKIPSQVDGQAIIQKVSWKAWLDTLWGLVAHLILSVGAAVFVFCYVDGNSFSVTEHFPKVRAIGETKELPFSPTQSDIVTILSGIIVVQKWAFAAWAAPLCWRVAIFLMEKRGLSHQEFKRLVKYRLLAPGRRLKDLPTLIIAMLLIACLAVNLSSPILTGAISWVPFNIPVVDQSLYPLEIDDIQQMADVRLSPGRVGLSSLTESAIGVINLGWTRNAETGVQKRVLEATSPLSINSTIENITLPYFKIHSIQWITDAKDMPSFPPNETGTYRVIFLEDKVFKSALDFDSGRALELESIGYTLLVPNTATNWTSDPVSQVIRERRLLILAYRYQGETLTQNAPANLYLIEDGTYAFAWVDFSAGVGRCTNHNCIVSSPSTISSFISMEVEAHPLAFHALSMAPLVSLHLTRQNSTLPLPWNDLDAYVRAILVRSYSGSWNLLNEVFASRKYSLYYRPALPSLVASINRKRVFGWLGIQLFVTLLSVVFLYLQVRFSDFPLVGDASLIGFYLNTLGVERTENGDPYKRGELGIDQIGDLLKVQAVASKKPIDSV